MVKRLKQSRLDCQTSIDEDKVKIHWIEKEEASIHERYDPLVKQLDERKKKREMIQKQIDEAREAVNNVRYPKFELNENLISTTVLHPTSYELIHITEFALYFYSW